MGLETATFLSGLTPTWPLAGDTKSQGDDHIRLIKATLQATFPNAVRAYYFPVTESVSANQTLDATDNQNTLLLDTSGGALTVTLPSTLGATDKGFRVTVIKSSTDANGILVSAAANISSKVGSTATIRVGTPYEPAIFEWNGTAWYCLKPGAIIGQVLSFDGPNTPPGFLDLDGSVYSNTTFAELFAVLATTTLRDRRGRADIGAGTGSGLTARVAGTNYGAETVVLAASELPAHTHPNTLNDPGHFHTGERLFDGGTGGGLDLTVSSGTHTQNNKTGVATTGITIINAANTGGGGAHANMQPSIAAKRIIRAC